MDPITDLETLDLELTLADVGTMDRRIEKVQGQAKARPRDFADQLHWLGALRAHLDDGRPARTYTAPPHHPDWTTDLNLLTGKPRLYVINVGEPDLPAGGPLAVGVLARAVAEDIPCLILCAACEAELATWSADEAAAYRADLGLPESGLHRLIHASYRLLDLITFFTITGGKETRAWTLRRGETALEAAGASTPTSSAASSGLRLRRRLPWWPRAGWPAPAPRDMSIWKAKSTWCMMAT